MLNTILGVSTLIFSVVATLILTKLMKNIRERERLIRAKAEKPPRIKVLQSQENIGEISVFNDEVNALDFFIKRHRS